MAAVLGQLAQHVEVDPAQRERAAPVPADDVVHPQGGRRAAGRLARLAVRPLDGGDGVLVVEDERLVRRRGDADLGPRPAGDCLVEPHLLDEGRVLHQAEQRGLGRHQRPARLLLGQPVQAVVQSCSVLVEEHLDLGARRLVDDVLGEGRGKGRHRRSIPSPSAQEQLAR